MTEASKQTALVEDRRGSDVLAQSDIAPLLDLDLIRRAKQVRGHDSSAGQTQRGHQLPPSAAMAARPVRRQHTSSGQAQRFVEPCATDRLKLRVLQLSPPRPHAASSPRRTPPPVHHEHDEPAPRRDRSSNFIYGEIEALSLYHLLVGVQPMRGAFVDLGCGEGRTLLTAFSTGLFDQVRERLDDSFRLSWSHLGVLPGPRSGAHSFPCGEGSGTCGGNAGRSRWHRGQRLVLTGA
jgi:hypothetical protein